jgi:hypothetical protein
MQNKEEQMAHNGLNGLTQKQTAVEYLVEQLIPKALSVEQYYHIRKAKEMEKEQIINAFYGEAKSTLILNGEQYYNETFKNK